MINPIKSVQHCPATKLPFQREAVLPFARTILDACQPSSRWLRTHLLNVSQPWEVK